MSAGGSSSGSDITVNVKGPQELKLSITVSPSKTIGELKTQIAAESSVEKERQRLIFSGKVLKDEETIASYKINTGHTLHMVKGADKSAATSGAAPTAAALPTMATGLNVAGNPADNMENMHHGLGGFNPFAGMGVGNLNDPNAMTEMMNSPAFMQQMSDMMSRPEVLDQIISSNPQLASMGPQIRQMMQNPMVRQMMSNPETMRMMMQTQAAQGGANGGGGFNPFAGGAGGAGGAGAGAAPATGDDSNLFAAAQNARIGGGAGGAAAANPFASLMGGAGGAGGANPLAGMFGGAGAGAGAGGANPFASLMGGAGGAGGNPFAGLGGFGAPPAAAAPQDTRPPEEIYATQLGQLNGMGLWDATKNIRALRMAGGNVEAAVDLLFSGQLD